MVVFALVGYFLIRAAIDYDPDKAVGLDGALAQAGARLLRAAPARRRRRRPRRLRRLLDGRRALPEGLSASRVRRRCPSLVLGPILRYVDERVATVWVQTDAAVRGRDPRRARAHLVRRRPALRARRGRRADARRRPPLRGAARRRASCGREPGSRVPAQHDPAARPGARREIAFGSCRITLPHEPPYVAARARASDGPGHRRAARLRAARGARPAAARRAPTCC